MAGSEHLIFLFIYFFDRKLSKRTVHRSLLFLGKDWSVCKCYPLLKAPTLGMLASELSHGAIGRWWSHFLLCGRTSAPRLPGAEQSTFVDE